MKAGVVESGKQELGLFTSACGAKLAVECESSCPTPTEEPPNTQYVVQCSVVQADSFVVSKHNKDDLSTVLNTKYKHSVHMD